MDGYGQQGWPYPGATGGPTYRPMVATQMRAFMVTTPMVSMVPFMPAYAAAGYTYPVGPYADASDGPESYDQSWYEGFYLGYEGEHGEEHAECTEALYDELPEAEGGEAEEEDQEDYEDERGDGGEGSDGSSNVTGTALKSAAAARPATGGLNPSTPVYLNPDAKPFLNPSAKVFVPISATGAAVGTASNVTPVAAPAEHPAAAAPSSAVVATPDVSGSADSEPGREGQRDTDTVSEASAEEPVATALLPADKDEQDGGASPASMVTAATADTAAIAKPKDASGEPPRDQAESAEVASSTASVPKAPASTSKPASGSPGPFLPMSISTAGKAALSQTWPQPSPVQACLSAEAAAKDAAQPAEEDAAAAQAAEREGAATHEGAAMVEAAAAGAAAGARAAEAIAAGAAAVPPAGALAAARGTSEDGEGLERQEGALSISDVHPLSRPFRCFVTGLFSLFQGPRGEYGMDSLWWCLEARGGGRDGAQPQQQEERGAAGDGAAAASPSYSSAAPSSSPSAPGSGQGQQQQPEAPRIMGPYSCEQMILAFIAQALPHDLPVCGTGGASPPATLPPPAAFRPLGVLLEAAEAGRPYTLVQLKQG